MNSWVENGTLHLQGTLIRAEGLDTLHAALRHVVEEADVERVEIDLSAVDGLDTAALQLLIAARRSAAHRNKPFRLVSPSIKVQEVLTLTGAHAIFAT